MSTQGKLKSRGPQLQPKDRIAKGRRPGPCFPRVPSKGARWTIREMAFPAVWIDANTDSSSARSLAEGRRVFKPRAPPLGFGTDPNRAYHEIPCTTPPPPIRRGIRL